MFPVWDYVLVHFGLYITFNSSTGKLQASLCGKVRRGAGATAQRPETEALPPPTPALLGTALHLLACNPRFVEISVSAVFLLNQV